MHPRRDISMKKICLIVASLLTATTAAAADSPYAGQELRSIKSLSPQDIEALRNGEGMGFAKPAELNHYPGPRHVLDLAQELGLTPAQVTQTEALFAQMQSDAKDLGEELLDAEAALDRAFTDGDIDAETLEETLLEIGQIRARLRLVHLEAHLRQKALLTDEQIALYDKLRGYGSKGMDHTGHSGHH